MQNANCPLYIGSRKRLDFPMGKLFAGGMLLVEPQEYRQYKARYGPIYRVEQLGANDRGFGYMLNGLINRAADDGNPYFLFCDDDILGFKWRDKHPFVLEKMFSRGVDIMKEEGLSQLMVSFAGHNWFYKGVLKPKIGAWCCFIGKTEDFLNVGGYDESLPIFNDWDMSARLIRAGKKNACWYEPMFVHKMKSRKGGAEDIYKRNGVTQEAIAILKAKYGEDSIRQVEAHGQVEARFNWAKL